MAINPYSAARKDLQEAEPDIRGKAGELKKNIQEKAEEAGTNVRHFLSDATEQYQELRDSMETRITHHPVRSVTMAAVGGLVLGLLFRR